MADNDDIRERVSAAFAHGIAVGIVISLIVFALASAFSG